MLDMVSKKSVVVIGGGTGIYPVLRGLKKYRDIDITAIITMADSGGSTGRLRDDFGQMPVGDVRMALAALSADIDNHDELLRELFLYRFNKGEGLDGHNLGNLLLVALTDMLGSELEAVKVASRILRIRGKVLPVTEQRINIVAEYDDGVVIEGEHQIDEPSKDRFEHHIAKLSSKPEAKITREAQKAIEGADLVLLGPGDLYSSLLANCVIEGVPNAITQSKGTFAFISNLMTSQGQTHGMTVSDHVSEVMKYTGRTPDTVIVNTGEVPEHLLIKYAESFQFPVVDDSEKLECAVIKENLLDTQEVVKKAGDVLQRSLVRGDADKMAATVHSLLQ